MSDESEWIHRAQTAEAQLQTERQASEAARERIKEFKANFGVKERADGTITIDYEKFAAALGVEQALELRGVIDQTYSITGEAGEKPKIRVKAGEAAA